MFWGFRKKFSKEITDKLLAPVNEEDIEIKPDGLIYLPEIMYRRILNQSFGPGGWGLMPRGEIIYQGESDGAQMVAREYALYCEGRFVSQSLGEHTFFGKTNQQYGNACESAKSSALRRCCKDLGISSELWDPKFVSQWKDKYAVEVWCQNQRTKEKKKFWVKKNSKQQFSYPWVAAA
uniref:Mitochondrial genome maintenance protein MGM101 n=2 Tax=Amphimedon queenslandica TaxID=400682 RepID=A0A1X7T6X7_AMPQE